MIDEGKIDIKSIAEHFEEQVKAMESRVPDMQGEPLRTPWSQVPVSGNVLQEYPRPQMIRDSYFNLNGYWDYCITGKNEKPADWGKILVPFSPESCLSGIRRFVKPDEVLWYKRKLPDAKTGMRCILHFGAVDQIASVYINDKLAVTHTGGYTGFECDITEYLLQEGNELMLKVIDESDSSWHSTGKQRQHPWGTYYTPQSGIWQTVWIEYVPDIYIKKLKITPHLDDKNVEIKIFTSEKEASCTVYFNGAEYRAASGTPVFLPAEDCQAWSPENPVLYNFSVKCGNDEVQSYFALRKISVDVDKNGVKRLFLNNKPYFQNGLLDQGYYPDGLYTAPSDEAMVFDIMTAKQMGFNLLRKHVKIEPMRWYYHCDRLGMLVWQDMPSGGSGGSTETFLYPMLTGKHVSDDQYEKFGRADKEGRDEYTRELDEMVNQLYNCPCIVVWVPFNEGWGQFDSFKAISLINEIDSTRPIDPASGWNDQKNGDIRSHHVYAQEYLYEPDDCNRAVALSEYGGLTLYYGDHSFSKDYFGYVQMNSPEELEAALREQMKSIAREKQKGLSAAVYTQLTDIEEEVNGLITYDRKIIKIQPKTMAEINSILSV